ncbi:MAG: TatD family hydrolase [Ardenticatenales bacterium]|nr:TatD family hydrolase [Ardenticatenales bacterium]
MIELIDSHFHLESEPYDGERDEIVARAVQNGVSAMITIGTSMESNAQAVALAERYDALWAVVGIHPNHAHEWGIEAEMALRGWASHPKVVAIGEIGLDYYWDRVPPERQQRAFEAQLALAAELALPVVIHDREAHGPVLATLRDWAATLPDEAQRGVLHCFSGDSAMAAEALEMGFYLGVDGPLTFKNARALQAMVVDWPLDRILIETDAPYLTPHPFRGKRNEPSYVRYVAEQLAELRQESFEAVARRTTDNARTLFQLEYEPTQ